MKDAEAQFWLSKKPGARPSVRYNKRDDDIVTEYVPQLDDEDIMIVGRPKKFPTADAAMAEAKAFQDAIRSNHPELA